MVLGRRARICQFGGFLALAAVALSGWTVGTDGRTKAFAFVVNGLSSTLTLKQSVDMLAATVVGCY